MTEAPSRRTTDTILNLLAQCSEVSTQQFYAVMPDKTQISVRCALHALVKSAEIERADRGFYRLPMPASAKPKRRQFESSITPPTMAQLMAGR